MSGELEAAGAMVTAGLAGAAIEGRGPGEAGEGACLNCGAPLSGRYCANCGQNAHPHRTLAHVLEEFVHGVLHFDTKAWRTLPMVMFRPGTLTYNYIHGKRARYISPLALFLFTIFFMFFVFAFALPEREAPIELDRPAAQTQEIEALREAVRDLEAEFAANPRASPALREARQALLAAEARERQSQIRAALEDESAEAPASEGEAESAGPAPAPLTWQDVVRRAAANERTVFSGDPEYDRRLRKKLENPDLVAYKVQQTAYKFSFVLAPLSLPFIALLFLWKRGVTLYDHMVYALYALSFAALLFVLIVAVTPYGWGGGVVSALMLGVLPAHTFFHLKGAYRLGWFSALWRTAAMLIFAMLILTAFLIGIFLIGLLG